ncbi:MAG: hypothetical protein K8T91_15190, partial [Planctomycetes bacterium]|nr:hypothetical protein [Planctomycetota bacterium]
MAKEGNSSADGAAKRFNFVTGAAVGSAIEYATSPYHWAPYTLQADMVDDVLYIVYVVTTGSSTYTDTFKVDRYD